MRITVALALLCVPLYGCSGHWMKSAQSQCAAFGYAVDSPQYAECVDRTYAEKREDFRRAVAAVGAGAGGMARSMESQSREMRQAAPQASGVGTYHPMGARFFRYSYISGMNRICVYDRLGSQEVETINAAAICPLN